MVEINIKFKPQTNSWADITVHKKKLHISETQYLSESLQCSDMGKSLEQVGDSVTHVLLLSSELANCESESLVCNIEIETKVNKYYYISVILENEIQFSKRKLQKFISLHEPAKSVTFMILDQCTGSCSTLMAVWIHDNYQKYALLSKLKGEQCNMLSFDLCLNFSLINVNYILLGRQISFYEIAANILWHNPTEQQKENIEGISWKQASRFCKDIGGHLPVFTSRDELDELLALIKLSQYMPPLMTIYIDLHVYNHFNLVGNLLYIQKRRFFKEILFYLLSLLFISNTFSDKSKLVHNCIYRYNL